MSFAIWPNSSSLRAFACLLALALHASTVALGQTAQYTDAPLSDVIEDIELSTPYRFLFRDALVSGVRVSMSPRADHVLYDLAQVLAVQGLHLKIDDARKVVFVVPAGKTQPKRALIRGTISDARSLERLPRATVIWETPEGTRGMIADDAGRFLIESSTAVKPLRLVASFVGYQPDTLDLDPLSLPDDLSIKLRPRLFIGSEVVVSSPLLSSNLDSTWFYLLNASLATPVGDQSVTRSLQALPAVGLTTAVSSGLNVRGSRADGFQMLLDGMPIYNQSHLFGMFDAFNPDALQTVDFYYGIAPARFQAPPGGTLSFLTRSGSKTSLSSKVGFTSTSASITVEGPAGEARAGWLLSTRRSFLDAVDWFNNDQLVAIGLGVGRETSGTRRIPLDERTLVSQSPSASFFDIHSKFDYEARSGASFQISAYAGGDNTAQDGIRVVAVAPRRADPLIRSAVTTANDWSNVVLSLHYRGPVRAWGYTHTYGGFTRYRGDYRKDDFFYRSPQQGNADPQLIFAPFLNENSLTDVRVAHDASFILSPTLAASAGFSAQRLVTLYNELSALRREFQSDRHAWQVDLYAEVTKRFAVLSTTLGLRPHYYSAGRYLRLSPRITIAAHFDSRLSASVGYTRNYQFTHHLYIENATGTDIWVLTTHDEGPGAVDHITAASLYRGAAITAQIETFIKWQTNLRRHETVLRPGSLPDGAVLFSPWTHDNRSRAKGIEILLMRRFGPASLTGTYTLSQVQIRHPDTNDGQYFPADWDRTHQLGIHGQLRLSSTITATTSINIASGQPNALSFLDQSERPRLPAYQRIDLGVRYNRQFSHFAFSTYLRLYNLLDYRNTWYRTLETVLVGRGQNVRLTVEPVDVYDLGIQPSFGLSLSF